MIIQLLGIRSQDNSQHWLVPIYHHYPDTGKLSPPLLRYLGKKEGHLTDLSPVIQAAGYSLGRGNDNLVAEIVLPPGSDVATAAGGISAALASHFSVKRQIALPGYPLSGKAESCTAEAYREILPGRPIRKHACDTLRKHPTIAKLHDALTDAEFKARQSGNYSAIELAKTIKQPIEFVLPDVLARFVQHFTEETLDELEDLMSRQYIALIVGTPAVAELRNESIGSKIGYLSLPVARRLVEDYRFNPATRWTMWSAAINGNAAVVKYLLDDGRAKPDPYNCEISRAAMAGDFQSWKLLFDAKFIFRLTSRCESIGAVKNGVNLEPFLEHAENEPDFAGSVDWIIRSTMLSGGGINSSNLIERYARHVTARGWNEFFLSAFITGNVEVLESVSRLGASHLQLADCGALSPWREDDGLRKARRNSMIYCIQTGAVPLTIWSELLDKRFPDQVKDALNFHAANAIVSTLIQQGRYSPEDMASACKSSKTTAFVIRYAPEPTALLSLLSSAQRKLAMDVMVNHSAGELP